MFSLSWNLSSELLLPFKLVTPFTLLAGKFGVMDFID